MLRLALFYICVNNRTYELSQVLKLAYTSYTLYSRRYLQMISYEPLFRTMKEKGITSYRLGKWDFRCQIIGR